MQSYDPIYLQRLVDGELDRDETRKMLKLAEDNPNLWRELASAYAENQLWELGFQKLDRGIEPESNRPANLAAGRSTHPHDPFGWLAIAASMMVALTAGLLIGQYNQPGVPLAGPITAPGSSMVAKNAPADEPPAVANSNSPGQRLVSYRPDYQMELQDANGNRVFDTEVPLYNLATANRAGYRVDRQPSLPADLVKRYAKNGYSMDQNVNYVSGRLGDGRIFVVPVRTVNLVRGQ